MAWAQLTAAQNSSAGTEYSLSIPSGSLITALDQFSKQTGLQVAAELTTSEQQQRAVNAVVGRFSASAALEQLLAGSELTYVWVDSSTVKIFLGAVPPEGAGGQRAVVVTGSRLDEREGPAPVRVYTRADIDRYGASTIPGLAGYFTQQPFSFGEWSQRSGAQHFQMRGLGIDTTLVLINGRRAPPSATSVSMNAFDLNTVPLSAVDRIEVMSDSASAIYGADAIGGVVNIILKEGSESPDVYFHYGSAVGGADERRLGGSVGLAHGRFTASLVLDYFERDPLIGVERDLWRNQDYRRFGGKDYRVPTASPANVYSLTGAALPGLSTVQASVPAGSTGLGLQSQDFLGTAGMVSLASSSTARSIFPDVEHISGFASAEFSLNQNLTFFTELLRGEGSVGSQVSQPFLQQQPVPVTNPYNPFGQSVAVSYSLAGMKPISQLTESKLNRFVLGARGGQQQWRWEVALTTSDEHAEVARVNELDAGKVNAALASADPQAALNPFVDGPAGSEALLSSLVADPQSSHFASGALLLTAFLRGPLWRMPGGMSEFVAGGEWRREELTFVDNPPVEPNRYVRSGFAELKLPLLESLTIKLAVRRDYYESSDDSNNPQYGVVWKPTRDWLVRFAYGTSFRPPSLPELYSRRLEFVGAIADSRRGGSVAPVKFLVGGNPELDNVSGHSFTAGTVYEPHGSSGMHFGAHYWRVVMDNRIIVPRLSDLEVLEDTQPDRVLRLAPTSTDNLAGWRGALDSVDISLLNYGRLETSGVDIDLSYPFDLKVGRLQTALVATWVSEYSAQEMGSTLPRDRVGVANLQGTIPEWRLVGSLSWEGRGWGTSSTVTFTPRYSDSDGANVLNRPLPSRTLIDLQVWFELSELFKSVGSSRLRLTGGVSNLFDKGMPFANAGSLVGYDASQGDLRGRFAYARISKDF